jgi:LSD1 subclass zinc finger protein
VNLAMELAPPPPPPAAAAAAVAHINCGGCGMTLMYAYGAQSVKCALCQYVTSIAMPPNMRMPLPPTQQQQQQQQQQQLRPIVPTAPQQLLLTPPVSVPSNTQSHHTQTVVVENPMTFDESGKLVSNVAVGVTTDTN